jgi:hypothetical protein
MPKSGLEEACASLSQIYEYYSYSHPKQIASPSKKLLKANINPIRKQPAFQVVDE